LRRISSKEVAELVKRLSIEANLYAPRDLKQSLREAKALEASPYGLAVLEDLLENIRLARD